MPNEKNENGIQAITRFHIAEASMIGNFMVKPIINREEGPLACMHCCSMAVDSYGTSEERKLLSGMRKWEEEEFPKDAPAVWVKLTMWIVPIDDGVALIGQVPLDEVVEFKIKDAGKVKMIFAPCDNHTSLLTSYREKFPEATFVVSGGVPHKLPALKEGGPMLVLPEAKEEVEKQFPTLEFVGLPYNPQLPGFIWDSNDYFVFDKKTRALFASGDQFYRCSFEDKVHFHETEAPWWLDAMYHKFWVDRSPVLVPLYRILFSPDPKPEIDAAIARVRELAPVVAYPCHTKQTEIRGTTKIIQALEGNWGWLRGGKWYDDVREAAQNAWASY
eukprot:TRINITY_DN65197_c0_g1_i2.p1 TRINITY_DN65197_c0_g1~~TRINITY_DN65197_c0_g1_i2.p1  ORF type:complete len:352 (-),score=36.02 TRINITY_DN65197_c0_g1_i2:172-1164(-)